VREALEDDYSEYQLLYGAQVPAHLMRVMILLRRDQRAAAWRATYDKERDRELS
jgi:hypothetical protein